MHNRLMDKDLRNGPFTMDDIALELGISKSTVSRALAGSMRISEETKRRVAECASAHGFIPNLAAKALAIRKTLNIAAVMPFEASGVEMMFFHECLSGMVKKAAESDYSVLVCMSDAEGCSENQLEKVIQNRKVDGVVLTQLRHDDRNLAYLKSAGFPFVVIGSVDDDGVCQVDSKMSECCEAFTRECVLREMKAGVVGGRGSVLFVCGSLDVEANNNRLSGFLSGMENPVFDGIQYAVCTDSDDIDGSVCDGNWSLILCSDDVVCVNVMSVLKAAGLVVGKDVRLASFHDSVLLSTSNPPVSALKVDASGLGDVAVDSVLSLVVGKKVERRRFVGCSFVFRESTD